MAEDVAIAKLVELSENNNYTKEQRIGLVTECWNMLEPAVKEAYQTQIDTGENGKITINGQEKEGINQFANSMNRLQNSFKPVDVEEAIENFRAVDKSKYSTELPLFEGSLIGELNKHPMLANAAAGISTQLATLTTADKNVDINRVTANILVGLVTNKSIFHKRSLDPNKINKFGQINPNLVIAAANYAKENSKSLSALNDKEIKAVGGMLKNACKDLDLTPNSKAVPPLAATKRAFKGVDLSVIIAKFRARNTVNGLPRYRERLVGMPRMLAKFTGRSSNGQSH